jgi:hypothetical protein
MKERRIDMGVYKKPSVFGKSYNFTPTQSSYQGMNGWWIFPNGWFVRRNEDGTITGSPNSDFSLPNYDLKVDIDGYFKFQDLGLNSCSALP